MRTGDPCTVCYHGVMKRRSTRTVGTTRTRYLKCDKCGHTGKQYTKVDELGRDVLLILVSDRIQESNQQTAN